VYKETEIINTEAKNGQPKQLMANIPYDEKPGIQAIRNKAADLNPVPGKRSSLLRDYQYK